MAGFQRRLSSAVRDRWTLVHFGRDRKEWVFAAECRKQGTEQWGRSMEMQHPGRQRRPCQEEKYGHSAGTEVKFQ